MKKSWVSFCFLFPVFVFAVLVPVSTGQLSPTETRILFQIQKLLEYPVALQGWSNWTNFCYLPPSSSLRIVCSGTYITELTVIGNKTSPSKTPKSLSVSSTSIPFQQTLSSSFSIDSFFTALTKLSNLRVLSLVSLGLWGPFPSKINRLSSLEVLNISSNFIYGGIPTTITKLQSLKSLVLADNLLNGSVPDLKGLAVLEELNLGQNQLGQKVPSLGENLVNVILRKNLFRSEIPSRIMELKKLQLLDISYNKFLGPIHSSLFSLPSIQYLHLAYNQLSGALSVNTTCNKNLKFVDISHNLLIGKLPSCIGLNSSNRTANISWNCFSSGNSKYQHTYSYCHKEAMAVKPPGDIQKQKLGNKLGLMLAIIGGVVGISGIVLLLVCAIVRRRRRFGEIKYEKSAADKLSVRGSPLPNRRMPQTRLPALGLPPYRVFTLEEIKEFTKNLDPSNLAAEGSQAQIYKGWLTDGSVVLIKCFKLKQKLVPQSLARHMEELPNLRHRHLVSVLGHCTVAHQDQSNPVNTVFVVNEYVSNGSLKDCLTDWKRKDALKWPQRMGITIGIARGIQHLHTGTAPGIFGNDIKIENILLDETLSAKISNYNILMPLKDAEGGLHLPKRSENLEKEDIFQFGAILLQVINGRPITATSELEDLKSEFEIGLVEGLKLRGVIDPSIQGSFAFDSLKTTIQIAINCLGKDPNRRPSIDDVLWNLQYSMQVQEGWTSSGNLGAFI